MCSWTGPIVLNESILRAFPAQDVNIAGSLGKLLKRGPLYVTMVKVNRYRKPIITCLSVQECIVFSSDKCTLI